MTSLDETGEFTPAELHLAKPKPPALRRGDETGGGI